VFALVEHDLTSNRTESVSVVHWQVSVTYRDIELTMTDQFDQCVDWLLLQSIGHRNSAAMTCGHLSGADRVIASRGNQLLLHFHSATPTASSTTVDLPAMNDVTVQLANEGGHSENNKQTTMKGFKIFIQGERFVLHFAAKSLHC
jgi:hypothetical protein